jgi:hypothetical protein
MYFFLTLKKVVHVLNEEMHVVPTASGSGTKDLTVTNNGEKSVAGKYKDQIDPAAAQIKAQELQLKKEKQLWIDSDYICKYYIINGLSDDLYDYYQSYNTFKDVWEALTKKYDTEEAGVKKYDVSRYMKYHRADPSPVQTGLHNWASKLEGPQFFFMQQ